MYCFKLGDGNLGDKFLRIRCNLQIYTVISDFGVQILFAQSCVDTEGVSFS